MQRSRKNDFVCRMVLTSEILLCKEDCCFKAKYSSVSNALILPLCHPASHLRCSGSLDHLSRFSGVYFFFSSTKCLFYNSIILGKELCFTDYMGWITLFQNLCEAQLKNKAYSESSRMVLSFSAVNCILPY